LSKSIVLLEKMQVFSSIFILVENKFNIFEQILI